MQRNIPLICSASKVGVYLACPAAPVLEQHARGLPRPASDAMERGTLLHKAMAGEVPDTDLPTDLQSHVVWARQQLEHWHRRCFGDDLFNVDCRVEIRIQSKSMPNFSGKPDVYSRLGKRALIVDWKTGEFSQLACSMADAQLKALAWLAMEQDQIEEAFVAVAWIEEHNVIERSLGAIEMSRFGEELRQAIQLADDRILRIGSHCGYCPAAHVCPAHAWYSIVLSGEQKSIASIELSAKIIKAARHWNTLLEAAKRLLATLPDDKLAELGLRRATRTSINIPHGHTAEAIARLADIIGDDVFEAVELSIPRAAEKLAELKGISSNKAKQEVLDALRDLVNTEISSHIAVV